MNVLGLISRVKGIETLRLTPLVHPLALHSRPHLPVHVPLMMLRLVHANVTRLILHPPRPLHTCPPLWGVISSLPQPPQSVPIHPHFPLLMTLPLWPLHIYPPSRGVISSLPQPLLSVPVHPHSPLLLTPPQLPLSITWPHFYHIVLPPLHSPALICFTCRQ